jgi:hypothetical protein
MMMAMQGLGYRSWGWHADTQTWSQQRAPVETLENVAFRNNVEVFTVYGRNRSLYRGSE